MSRYANIRQFLSQWGRVSRYAVALCWLTGLLLGFCAAKSSGSVLISAVRDASLIDSSFLAMVLNCTLPFLICYLSFSAQQKWMLPAICFYKAFCFAFCSSGVAFTYGNAGWLIRFLLIFSDCMILPALIFTCMTAGQFKKKHRLFLAGIAYAFLVAVVDYIYIVPLLKAAVS